MRIYGCTESDAIGLNDGKPLRSREGLAMAFVTQKHAAKRRGIEWCMSFREWVSVWRQSGQLGLRGVGVGRYVMARHGDEGPYAVENVSIELATDNSRDGLATRFRVGV